MEENWYALLLSIFRNVDAMAAVRYLKYGVRNRNFKVNINVERPMYTRKIGIEFSEEEKQLALDLKETHSWDEVAAILNINASTLRSKLYRYNKKAIVDGPTKAPLTISLNKNTVTL